MAQVGGEEYGPFTWDQMLQMSAEGRVTPELPIRKASDSQWSTAADIPGLLGGPKSAAPAPKPAPKPAARPAAPSAASTPAGKSTVKKAKPLARPPSGRPVPPVVTTPQNIPAGIPVGAPVGTPAAAPPVAASSALGAFNFDLGAAPGGKPRSVKKSALDDDDEDDVVTKKTSRAPLILGVLGGVTVLVAVIVGLTIYITMFRGGKEEQLVATNASDETKAAKVKPGERNPGQVAPEGEAETSAKRANKNDAKDAKVDDAALQTALKSIRDWKNAATLKTIVIGNAKISIGRIWLGGDAGGKEAGRATEPPAEAAEVAKDGAPAAAATPAEGGSDKFVCVEVIIANKAGAPLKYKGWNIAKSKVPFMADDQDRILKLVPASQTPGVARLTKADVPGGGAISEILVFQAPAEGFEKLRLVLPQNVFYDNTKNPYTGIEFTPDVLENGGGPPAAVPPASIAGGEANDPLVSGRRVSSDPALPESPAEIKPEPKTAAKAEPPPPKKPSLIDEINKSFEGEDKGKKMDEGKGAESEKKPEPAKKTEPTKKPEPAKKTAPKGKK